jgi:hypothetical protein
MSDVKRSIPHHALRGRRYRRRRQDASDTHVGACPPCHSRVSAERAVRDWSARGAGIAADAAPDAAPRARRQRGAASAVSGGSASPGSAPSLAQALASDQTPRDAVAPSRPRRRLCLSGDRSLDARACRGAHNRSRQGFGVVNSLLASQRQRRGCRAGDGGCLRLADARPEPTGGARARWRPSVLRARQSCPPDDAITSRYRCSCCRSLQALSTTPVETWGQAAVWSKDGRTFVLVANRSPDAAGWSRSSGSLH